MKQLHNKMITNDMVTEFVETILDDLQNCNYDYIVSVNQGGAVLASMIGFKLGLRVISYDPTIIISNDDLVLIVDDIIDTGHTMHKVLSTIKNADICVLVDNLVEKTGLISSYNMNDILREKNYDFDNWFDFWWEYKNDEENGIAPNITRILQFLGEDVNREGLVETPARVAKSYAKLYGGYKQDPKDIMKTFVDGACDEMVVLKNIALYSTCEHHMIPFTGKAHIAYIPNGKVIGISKLARLLEIFARRLQIQERIGQQVVDALNTYLEPLGAACIIEAQHMCMTARGVEKAGAVTVTSALSGVFKTSPAARQELMAFIKD